MNKSLQDVIRKKRKKPSTDKMTPGEITITSNSNLLQKKKYILFITVKHWHRYIHSMC